MGGGSIFWKTREIGLPSYSKICTLCSYHSINKLSTVETQDIRDIRIFISGARAWKTDLLYWLMLAHTVIRFVSNSAKFGNCSVVGLTGNLLKINCARSRVNVSTLASTSVPLRPTKVQVPNLALKLHCYKP
jgi:hypothetical protein